MPTVVLKLSRAPSDASREQTPQAAAPLLRGTGDTDYLCGNCGFVIASGIGPRQRVAVALQNKAVVYDILFRAAVETLKTIAADPKHLGAAIGVTAVLHTWGQNLFQNPHS